MREFAGIGWPTKSAWEVCALVTNTDSFDLLLYMLACLMMLHRWTHSLSGLENTSAPEPFHATQPDHIVLPSFHPLAITDIPYSLTKYTTASTILGEVLKTFIPRVVAGKGVIELCEE